MPKWVRLEVRTHPEAQEAMAHQLTEMGAEGLVLDSDGSTVLLTAYFPLDDAAGERLLEAKRRLDRLESFGLRIAPARVSARLVEFDQWDERWKSHFNPQRFGDRLLITPTWIPVPDDAPEAVVLLDPGMAFGTGAHPSTQLCLDFLVSLDVRGWRVADVGTGSGILAIAAAKLGARQVEAVDIDPDAVQVARENVEKNAVASCVKLTTGTIETLVGPYDLILMNILAGVILPALPAICQRLAVGGLAVLSGITTAETSEVKSALMAKGLSLLQERRREEWSALLVSRAESRLEV
ncbi:MAG: ribosomal protein L11 methyltransferase [Candidatus Poribacteria bacterium]|nr:MAG: ribosomal protein L11 methyltransferase [Candidatus Poribacteria bacterium]